MRDCTVAEIVGRWVERHTSTVDVAIVLAGLAVSAVVSVVAMVRVRRGHRRWVWLIFIPALVPLIGPLDWLPAVVAASPLVGGLGAVIDVAFVAAFIRFLVRLQRSAGVTRAAEEPLPGFWEPYADLTLTLTGLALLTALLVAGGLLVWALLSRST